MKSLGAALALLVVLLAALIIPQTSLGMRDRGQAPHFQPIDRLVAKEATLELRVLDTQQAVRALQELLLGYGGEIISQREWTNPSFGSVFRYASVSLRLPADSFEQFLLKLRGLSMEVLNENITGADLTDAYVDYSSTLRSLEKERQGLYNLFIQAQPGAETLRIHEELLKIAADITVATNMVQGVVNKTSYALIFIELDPFIPTSTPTLTLTPVPTPTSTPWAPGLVYAKARQAQGRLMGYLSEIIQPGTVAVIACILLPFFMIWVVRQARKKRASQR